LLALYHERKVMKSLGVTTTLDDLDVFELRAYCIIEDEIAKQRELERKRQNGSRRNNRH